MYSHRPHPLLEQVPLTVSPFVSLPTATTLSYTYKTMPSNIPPSALGIPNADTTATTSSSSSGPTSELQQQQQQQPKPRFIVSQSGNAAHPDDIVASCQALHAHVTKMQEDADRELRAFEERIRERDLAEKRRLAPGWLDSDARLLQPEKGKAAAAQAENELMVGEPVAGQAGGAEPATDEGAALDRAFGGISLR
ncbi:uncharacterized protein BBA_01998 [Beauveria bassiana ARSEF 2860]|uniref:Uncharacterized protein n=1 Tax=Beauveria bassiana (strain ARSEF 2860) TaxID=655819 RepID=J5JWG7_BEAB2|nr:uncharacterized protein BBA_01998 [Beauveria bassiana ARSEF 2860]EJP68963.1 hypothetical protein BBA_01998 [Beauveria bassiana ARSEF 2860]